jgi:hypothetical protein
VILLAQLVHQQRERLLDERQPAGALHRAGDVDEEDEVGRGRTPHVDFACTERDAQQIVPRVPRRGGKLGRDAQRHVSRRRSGVTVREVVDELLDAHGVLGRQRALIEEAAHVGVRRAIDVDGEGGERCDADGTERILVDALVRLGVPRLARAADATRHRGAVEPGLCLADRRRCGGDADRGRRAGEVDPPAVGRGALRLGRCGCAFSVTASSSLVADWTSATSTRTVSPARSTARCHGS